MDDKRYWFRQKTTDYGKGFVPASPAGWIAIVIFVLIAGGGTVYLSIMDTRPFLPVVWALGWLVPFIVLLYAKCEPKQ